MKIPDLNIKRLVVCLTFLAVFAMSARISVDTDTWWHLRAGQLIVEHRAVLQQDVFSYTMAGEIWQYPGWLVEVPMYAIYQTFGPGGLNIWTAAMVTLTFCFVWMTLSGGEFTRAFVTILAAAASGVFWAARPNLMTFLLAGVFLWILDANAERKRWNAHSHNSEIGQETGQSRVEKKTDSNKGGLDQEISSSKGAIVGGKPTADRGRPSSVVGRLWLLPVLMIIWANSHGGFAVGFILWGAYFVDALARWRMGTCKRANMQTLLIIGLFMVLAVCINPSGPAILLYAFKTLNIGVLQDFIQEWQSPNFHHMQVQPFLWLLLLTIAAIGTSRKRISLVDYLLLSGFAYLGFVAGRNIALFALAAPMILTRHALPFLEEAGSRLGFRGSTQTPVRASRWQSILNWIILGVLILAVALKSSLVIPIAVNQEHFEESLPVAAVAFLKDKRPEGQLFNSYNWGGYLLWALPEYPVFVDGRTDLYGDELIRQWMQVVQADDGWQEALEQWDVGVILLEPDRPVVDKLSGEGWELLFEDDIAVVYGR
ncbi:MAG: hypothetical protein ISS57_04805 [Anaerolineales bacterium]|nr:hypothetical protein [Anaerolineales bacterium]